MAEKLPGQVRASTASTPVTKTGSTDRRGFLKKLAVTGAGGAAVAAGAGSNIALAQNDPDIVNLKDWNRFLGADVDSRPYGQPSPFESDTIRRSVEWLTATRESSINFTPIHKLDGIITPSGVAFERHHGGAPDVNPQAHKLMIHGLVDQPLVLTMDELRRFPPVDRIHFLECAANGGMEWRGSQLNGCQYTHGMIHCVQYTGVPLKTLLQEAGIKTAGKWILAEGADASGMSRSIPLEKALDDVLVAYSMNGERLRPEQGYPLRLVVPGWEGNMWIKWLRRIEIGDKPWYHREETSKYTDLLPNGKAKEFTWVMDAKSIITEPSPQLRMTHEGPQVLRGLAWSGNGKVKRVDVSFDGGNNWVQAELQGPVIDKALTRFYVPWTWTGETVLMQSRAIDESGYVQPTYQQLHDLRGVNSVYHNNGIQTWRINPDGTVENVRMG